MQHIYGDHLPWPANGQVVEWRSCRCAQFGALAFSGTPYSADLRLGPCSPSMLIALGDAVSSETLGGQPQDDHGIEQVLCVVGTWATLVQ